MRIPEIPKLTKKTWALIAGGFLAVAAVSGLGLARFTTAHPLFCLSCHQNQEPRELWFPSRAHPQSVTCTDCHASPGGIVPAKFSAGDERMNRNCLRCHPDIPSRGPASPDDVRLVFVSHKLHAENNALCLDCHRNIEHDRLTPRTHRPAMETCYQCHHAHPRTQACEKCHPIRLVSEKAPPGS